MDARAQNVARVLQLLTSNIIQPSVLGAQSAFDMQMGLALRRSAAKALLELVPIPGLAMEIEQQVTASVPARLRVLRSLFNLAGSAPAIAPLSKRDDSAVLLRIGLQHKTTIPALSQYLSNDKALDGAAGLRCMLRLWNPSFPVQSVLRSGLATYIETLVASNNHKEDRTWIQTLYLLELSIRMGFLDHNNISEVVRNRVRVDLLARPSIASLLVLRALVARPELVPLITDDEVTGSVLAVAMGSGGWEEKCLAFNLSAVLVGLACSQSSEVFDDRRLLEVAVQVFLWDTVWQHSAPKDMSVR